EAAEGPGASETAGPSGTAEAAEGPGASEAAGAPDAGDPSGSARAPGAAVPSPAGAAAEVGPRAAARREPEDRQAERQEHRAERMPRGSPGFVVLRAHRVLQGKERGRRGSKRNTQAARGAHGRERAPA